MIKKILSRRPLVLMILDGWGYRDDKHDNAILAAHTPQWDHWWKTCPHTLLNASGHAVGLPDGQMGNSEVGHMNMGAGRVIHQDFTRINDAILDGSFATNSVFLSAIENSKKRKTTLHVLGLLSNGGVHSHENHLFAFLQLCQQQGLHDIALHLFLDGRDTAPRSALDSLNRLNQCLKANPVGRIATLTGRYFAMDRDKRWERVEPVYRLLTENQSEYHFDRAEDAIHYFYQQGITDEFIPPTRINQTPPIQSGDALFFFNYRADRARQLTQALLLDSFDGFVRTVRPRISPFLTMTSYADNLPTELAFPPPTIRDTLGEIVSKHGLSQLRLAETEKYAHVTFFFNGGIEEPFPNEQRQLIPSPKVKTYDLQPEMSAPALTTALVNAITSKRFDLIICNYANADMVGHTGDFNATVKAIESLDHAMHATWEALERVNGQLLITSDHGNAECMYDADTHQKHTAHTTYPVPLLYVGESGHFNTAMGSLIDVAPTALALLGITPPSDMTGTNLLVLNHDITN